MKPRDHPWWLAPAAHEPALTVSPNTEGDLPTPRARRTHEAEYQHRLQPAPRGSPRGRLQHLVQRAPRRDPLDPWIRIGATLPPRAGSRRPRRARALSLHRAVRARRGPRADHGRD